jgi:hypothetical protein
LARFFHASRRQYSQHTYRCTARIVGRENEHMLRACSVCGGIGAGCRVWGRPAPHARRIPGVNKPSALEAARPRMVPVARSIALSTKSIHMREVRPSMSLSSPSCCRDRVVLSVARQPLVAQQRGLIG